MLFSNNLRSWAPFTALMLCLIVIFLAYQPGFSGGLYYDDMGSLPPLAHVEDLSSALYFVFSDSSGLLGRPLAMASFLPHVQGWPDNTTAIFLVNTVLHLTNGLLVAGIALQLLCLMRGHAPGNAWLAIGTAALWLVLPLQVSTSLIAIQRMAGLSAFFVLAGLLVYFKGLSIQVERPRTGLLLQGIGLGLFTLLAMFAKENGVLLPVFAWVIEFTLLAQCDSIIRWRKVRFALLSTVLLALVAYLASATLNAETGYLNRPFTLAQRLMTEPQILIEYLRLAFLPDIFAFSPFHDDYARITSLIDSPIALISLIVWAALLIGALVWRQRFPMPAFAILWFLAAHLLESSVIPLELYFEYRNYVALFGPCLALVWLTGQLSSRYPRLAPAAFITYLIVQTLVLVQVTSLWGNRLLAAEMWFKHNPNSSRATVYLAAIRNNEWQDAGAALQILDQRLKTCPYCLHVAIQAIMLSCTLEPEEKLQLRLASIEAAVKNGFVFSQGIVQNLESLNDMIKRGKCPAISWSRLEGINRLLLENRSVHATGQTEGLHVILDSILQEQGEYSRAMEELQAAWQINRNHGIAYLMVDLWLSQKQFQEAAQFAENEMCREMPRNPILAHAALERCKSIQERVRNAAL